MTLLKTVLLLFFFNTLQIVNGQGKYINPDGTVKQLDPAKAELAKSMALSAIRLIGKGEDIDSIVMLCDIPFAWDRKKIIDNRADLKASFTEVIQKKGKNREFKIDSVYVQSIKTEIIDYVIPIIVYRVIVRLSYSRNGTEKTTNILFAVELSQTPKIVGFTD